MDGTPSSQRHFRFGVFDVDFSLGRLVKRGLPVHLQEKPYRILELLIERNGSVVTREELRNKLWPANTFVEFDEGLNTAVGKLRHALGDSTDSPKFIETVRGKGYRWIGPLLPLHGSEDSAPRAEKAISSPFSVAAQVWGRQGIAIGVLSVVLILGLLGVYREPNFTPVQPAANKSILIADFVNSTGEPIFDDTLREALAAELSQSPFFTLISDHKSRETMHMMERATDERIVEETALEVCQRSGGDATVAGSIASLGTQYVIQIRAINCRMGSAITRVQSRAEMKESVLAALDSATIELRGKLGESMASLEKFDTPIESATTPSLEALKAFSRGRKALTTEDPAAPFPWFKEAIQLDPNFALAYANLAAAYSNIGENNLAQECIQKAFELRERVSQKERLYIESHYYGIGKRDFQKALEVYAMLAQLYPNDWLSFHNAGWIFMYEGQFAKAQDNFRRASQLAPESGLAYSALMICLLSDERLNEAVQVARQAHRTNLDSAVEGLPLYLLGFLENDDALMKQQVSWSKASPSNEHWMLSVQSETEAFHGRLNRAREFSRQAVASANNSTESDPAAMWEASAALREAEFGNRDRARALAGEALRHSRTQDTRIIAAMALARIKENVAAQFQADWLAKAFPSDTQLNLYWLPSIAAAIQLNQGKPEKALELLRTAEPMELGLVGPTFQEAALYPVYLRAEAFAALNRQGEAAAEFQKFTQHPGATKNFVLRPLALLKLGRARAAIGDGVGARKAYSEFLTLWDSADPDLLVLTQAKAEFAKLH